MSSRNLAAAASLALIAALPAHALGPGELQFVSFNADNESLAIVTLGDLAANTSFFLTDNEWTGTSFNTGESYHRWDTGASSVAAGTVIHFAGLGAGGTPGASQGSLSRVAVAGSSSYGISQTAETVYLYHGSSATTPLIFLSAVSTGDFSEADGSLAGTGLAAGVNAIQLAYGSDSADYVGDRRSGMYSLADPAQWLDRGDGNHAALSPDLTAFASPVPEPSAAWLGLAGALALWRGRRRPGTGTSTGTENQNTLREPS